MLESCLSFCTRLELSVMLQREAETGGVLTPHRGGQRVVEAQRHCVYMSEKLLQLCRKNGVRGEATRRRCM